MGKLANIKNFIKKVVRFGWYIPVTNLILTYGQKYFSAKTLSNILKKRTRKIQNILSKSISFPSDYEYSNVNYDGKEAPIWVCWLQGEDNMPLIPRLCLQSIRKHANGHKVIVLTLDNYNEYVKIPQILIEMYHSGKIKPAHFTDILRINLLAQQGGLWLDATMLVTKDVPQEIFEYPFFSIKTENRGYFVSQCRWAVFCLGTQKGNPLFTHLASLFEQYIRKNDIFVDYFLFDNFIDMLYKRYPTIKKQIDNLPFNNPHVHDMTSLLCENVTDEKFYSLTKDSYLFKLSHNTYKSDMLLKNPDNLYHRLVINNKL